MTGDGQGLWVKKEMEKSDLLDVIKYKNKNIEIQEEQETSLLRINFVARNFLS